MNYHESWVKIFYGSWIKEHSNEAQIQLWLAYLAFKLSVLTPYLIYIN